jgi:clan AA aspartic protease
MGVFSVTAGIGDPAGNRFRDVEFTVDTGSSYTSLPASILLELGVRPHKKQRFVMADGRRVESDLGRTWIRINGEQEITIVIFAEERTEPLLGATTLQELGLAINPVDHKLVPVDGYRLTRIQADD